MILLFLQLAASAASPPQLDAVRFEMVVTNQTVGLGSSSTPSVVRQTSVQSGDRLRTSISALPMSSPAVPGLPSIDGFTTYNGKTREIVIVDTVKREYYIVNLDSLAARPSPMLEMLKESDMTMSIDTAEVKDLGPGPDMHGRPTRLWRMKEHMTMSAAMMGESMRITMGIEADLHYANDSSLPANSAGSVAPGMMKPFESLLSKEDAARSTMAAGRLPKAFLMKSVSKVRSTTGGFESGLDSTMEVVRIEKIRIDSKHFDVPAGYKRIAAPNFDVEM